MRIAITLLCCALLAAPASAAEWRVPRTPEGKPDLQGVWSNATRTPLQRATSLGERRAYTDEEALALESRLADLQTQANAASDPARPAPTEGDIGSYNDFWLERGPALTRIAGEYRTSLIIDPPDGRIPFLPESERVPDQLTRWRNRAGVGLFDGPELQTIGERCLLFFDYRTSNSGSGPPMMPMYYNNNYQIIQTADYVVILTEMIHDARIIRLDASHQPAVIKKWMGDSIGVWEGDTLVVTTRHFHPQQSHFGASEQVVVTERFERNAPDQIDYTFTMEDPAVYASAWTAQMAFRARPAGEQVYEYACHEGNYALIGILAGARRQEQLDTGN